RANTRWITNPDGYFAPGELLDTFGFAANAFPYQLLVDEALDNREDLSNGGSPTGNFGTHGWSKADFAAGITGYGIWGQGQASVHTLRIDRTALAISGPITLRAAIIVKYEDPRGGLNSRERRANRLPQDNPALFAYRMPHGALDVETIELLAVNSQFRAGEEGSASIAARVRDWDARATEAGTVHLAGQSDVTLVSMGESGLPQVDVSAPGLPGGPAGLAVADDDTAYGGDPEPDSGQATDELLFTGTLMGTPPAEGTYTALLRARDITDIAPPPGWETVRINLSPDLVNLGTSIEGASFAALRFTVEGVAGERPRAAWLFRDGNQTVTGAGSITVDLTVPVLDPSNTSGNYTVEVDFGDHPIETFNHNVADGPQSYSHVYVYSGTPPDPQTYTVAVNVIDGDTPTLQAFAVPPEDPTVTVLPPSDFTGWARSWGGSDFDMAMSADVGPDGSVVVGGMFRSSPLDLGGGSRTSSDGAAYVMKFDAAGTYLWDRVYDGAEHDRTEDVTVLADGSIIAVGSYGGAVDFGGGTRTQAGGGDGFVVKLTGEGNHVWDRTWG
ncbi:MAG TPA: hypothetical protein VEI97_17685, partial [bacterium]|nr:hypothetical protein [bacterium]